jgi:hypothetical protein
LVHRIKPDKGILPVLLSFFPGIPWVKKRKNSGENTHRAMAVTLLLCTGPHGQFLKSGSPVSTGERLFW